jgi:hypothetical protein
MAKIIVEIEISNIEQWSVDWYNDAERTEALMELRRDIIHSLSNGVGVDGKNVDITKCIIED